MKVKYKIEIIRSGRKIKTINFRLFNTKERSERRFYEEKLKAMNSNNMHVVKLIRGNEVLRDIVFMNYEKR